MVRFTKHCNSSFPRLCKILYYRSCLTVHYIGRHDFGSVNPEIRIIEGRISEVLLYFYLKYYADLSWVCLVGTCIVDVLVLD